MGYDQPKAGSSGAMMAVLGAVLLVGILAIIFVAGLALLWVGGRSVQTPAIAVSLPHDQATFDTPMQIVATTEAVEAVPGRKFHLLLDREGNATVDGATISLAELKIQLARLQEQTHNVFEFHIEAAAQCPIAHLVPILDVCEEVGDIDVRVTSTESDSHAVDAVEP